MNELKELYTQVRTAIDEIDEKLDAQTDQSSASKRKITNDLIDANRESWEPAANSLISQLSTADVSVQIGVYYGLIRELQKSFSESLAAELNKLVEEQPKVEVEKLSDEEIAALGKVRSELYGKVKSLIDMAEQFGMADGMEMPKRRTGKKGPRGPRAITAFTWEIDGVSYDKLKDVAEVYDQFEKTSDLTKAMREAGLDLKEPGDRLEFTLPDGKILVGVRTEDEDEESEED